MVILQAKGAEGGEFWFLPREMWVGRNTYSTFLQWYLDVLEKINGTAGQCNNEKVVRT